MLNYPEGLRAGAGRGGAYVLKRVWLCVCVCVCVCARVRARAHTHTLTGDYVNQFVSV